MILDLEDELVVTKDDPALKHPIVGEIIRQMRAIDAYGVWDNAGENEIIDPFVMTKERKRQVPIIGDPDEEVIARVKAWYNALAVSIEGKTGLMAVPIINISHEGFGRALIAVGKLIVVDRNLRDVHRFGFKSLDLMQDEAGKIIDKAAALVEAHRDVAKL
ncbi:probable nitrogen fixation protein [Cohaesibacter sp. ES.047]|uniref:NifX-associated nitrogen fixation protein n=1 Tax=Cohaesibacter sp. ES.047 TaxID=1798205 RepID=UPI000BB84F19|nr:NifX-associated nitrogen fixation protein [Cohaesibacter sp. ES.047]SNY92927.1 probable nitrogen fixation protein [Cohaesibacter sp. ES.047]